jgi:FolB domain-containing protein
MDKIFIKDLIVRGILGVNDWERTNPQDILINIIVYTDTHQAAETDEIEECINYRDLAKKIQAHAESAARFTVEALANDLAVLALSQRGVKKVCVKVEKPGAVRFSRSVGIEIERSRTE